MHHSQNKTSETLTVDGSGFKDQFDQGLMNPIARETQDTVTGDNPQKEYIAQIHRRVIWELRATLVSPYTVSL